MGGSLSLTVFAFVNNSIQLYNQSLVLILSKKSWYLVACSEFNLTGLTTLLQAVKGGLD